MDEVITKHGLCQKKKKIVCSRKIKREKKKRKKKKQISRPQKYSH